MKRPDEAEAGSFLLAVIVAPPSQPSKEKEISTPSRWEQIDQCLHVARYWKFVDAGEDPQHTWEVPQALVSPSIWVGMIFAYSGVQSEDSIIACSCQPICQKGNVDDACKQKEGNPPSQCCPD